MDIDNSGSICTADSRTKPNSRRRDLKTFSGSPAGRTFSADCMMGTKTVNGVSPPRINGDASTGAGERKWELRPGGMLVQKRTDTEQSRVPPRPTIRVRVKYGETYHEIHISSQATFGELKKMLSGPTGLHHQDQKLFYKKKERDSNAFLDTVGVKDKSKLVLKEDPISQEKHYIEMKKNAQMEKASKIVSQISLEVDKLAGQVFALESVASKGRKVVESDVVNLTALLMNQLVKLDGISADGDDVKLQRKMQVSKVQKYIETLDVLKLKSSLPASNGSHNPLQQQHTEPQKQQQYSNDHISSPRCSNGSASSPVQHQQAVHSLIDSPHQQQQTLRRSASEGPVVITTQWETFDSTPAPLLDAPSSSKTGTSSVRTVQPNFTWDLL